MFKLERIKALTEEIAKANILLNKNNELFEQMAIYQKEVLEELKRIANLETEFIERLTQHLAFDMKMKKEEEEARIRREMAIRPTPYDLKY